MPADPPVITPVDELMVAIIMGLMLHVPPGVGSVTVSVEPTQTVPVPTLIGAGSALTVNTDDVKQPPGSVYVIVVVPSAKVVTTPVEALMVATVVLLLVHVPPPDVCVSVAVLPRHALSVPSIAGGALFTVTTVVV